MKKILIHAWSVLKIKEKYYLPYTHWIYLNEIVKYYDSVCLLSPVNRTYQSEESFEEIGVFNNVEIYELPYSDGYLNTVKHFFRYKNAYKELSKNYDVAYARYPIPFGWLQMNYFRDKKRIIHFVGDPIDTIVNNPKLSAFKKALYKTFFRPENYMFMLACKGASVYTNGYHIAEKLKAKGIKAIPLVSSTLNDPDFYFEDKVIDIESPRIIYVGYLRKAKGVETILRTFTLLQKVKPNAVLSIVGHGELEAKLKREVIAQNIQNVTFTGHIDNRDKLNQLLREHDIFCFASLSEGSPRVVLEAMANGLAVVSTPVGSLPATFEDKKEILFANFNDENDFIQKLLMLSGDREYYDSIRSSSYKKVINFKIDNFLKRIFNET